MIVLGNPQFQLELLDPLADADRLGSRYSHSGYIWQVRADGRDLLTMPFAPFEVFHGTGFPDEFEQPVGYQEARVGEGFVKLGVGAVEKNADHAYTNHDRHRVLQPAEHDVRVEDGRVVFGQALSYKGYGYAYEKRIELTGEASFRIAHRLANTGQRAWESFWYSHIFLARPALGAPAWLAVPQTYQPTDENPLTPSAGRYPLPAQAEICAWWQVPPGLCDAHQVGGPDRVFSARCDSPCMGFMFYQNPRVVSPEPRVAIALQPGQDQAWSTEYALLRP